jgi:hypothetical protein
VTVTNGAGIASESRGKYQLKRLAHQEPKSVRVTEDLMDIARQEHQAYLWLALFNKAAGGLATLTKILL